MYCMARLYAPVRFFLKTKGVIALSILGSVSTDIFYKEISHRFYCCVLRFPLLPPLKWGRVGREQKGISRIILHSFIC